MSDKSSPEEYNNKEVIFEPIALPMRRDDRKGLASALSGSSGGFSGIITEDGDGEVFHIQCHPGVPTDEELERHRERLRKEDAALVVAEEEIEDIEEAPYVKGWKDWLTKWAEHMAKHR